MLSMTSEQIENATWTLQMPNFIGPDLMTSDGVRIWIFWFFSSLITKLDAAV